MDKIAIIVHRYGPEINGGAEEHARMLAERLKALYNVDVLTSCALNFPVWDNHYPVGEERMNGVRVLRFTHEHVDLKASHRLGRYLRGNWKYFNTQYRLSNIITLSFRRFWYRKRKEHAQIFERWIENDGPVCKEMMSFLQKEKEHYKAFIFFTYLFYPTYKGLPLVSEKSIFIPTAHDESYLYFAGFSKLFAAPRFIMYNSAAEKELVESAHPETKKIKSNIAGVGFDMISSADRTKPLIEGRYFVYIGRIDTHKGCKELLSYFLKFRKETGEDILLVMIGKNHMSNFKKDSAIRYMGFISEEEKLAYLQHSEALIIPSRFESLSMVTLEAMALGKPVLANGHCEVLRSHIDNSKAGYAYYDQKDFNGTLQKILTLTEEEKAAVKRNGTTYVNENYKWDNIINKFADAINDVSNS